MVYLGGRAAATAGEIREGEKRGPEAGGGAKGSEFDDEGGDHIAGGMSDRDVLLIRHNP